MKDLISFILALIPILSIYATGLPGISLAELFIIFCGTLCLQRKGNLRPYFFTYVIYSLIITFCSLVLGYNDFSLSLRTIMSFLMFIYFFSVVPYIGKIGQVLKYLLVIGNISCIFLIFQYLVLSISGYIVPGVLSFLPLSNEINTEEFLVNITGRDRLSSFFTEPAHFCEFLVIVLTIRLFLNKQEIKSVVLAIMYTICIIISKSAIGFASILFIWGIWLIKVTDLWSKHKFLFLVITLLIVIGIIPILAIIGDDSIINRFTQISFTPEASNNGFSSYIRVLRGYIPFMESNMIVKLFGGGIGSIYSFVNNNPNTDFLLYVDYNIDYLNSVQYVLLYTGIIGLIIMGKHLYKLYIKTVDVGKILLLVSLLQMFACGYFFSMNFLIVMYIVINCKKNDISNYSNL